MGKPPKIKVSLDTLPAFSKLTHSFQMHWTELASCKMALAVGAYDTGSGAVCDAQCFVSILDFDASFGAELREWRAPGV